jgi:hypothetical protein
VQLAAASSLSPIELDPQPSPELIKELSVHDAFGEAGLLELTATSFGTGKAGTFPARHGGDIGRLVPLLNDIAENIQTLRAMTSEMEEGSVFDQLVRCQLPAEVDELLRLGRSGPFLVRHCPGPEACWICSASRRDHPSRDKRLNSSAAASLHQRVRVSTTGEIGLALTSTPRLRGVSAKQE